jgi:hypothetical protein
MAQEKIYTRGNSKIAEMKDLLAEERANLKIMWISAHVGIGDNERADKARRTRTRIATGHKVGKLDYWRWVKEEFKRKRQNDWSNCGNTMVTTRRACLVDIK